MSQSSDDLFNLAQGLEARAVMTEEDCREAVRILVDHLGPGEISSLTNTFQVLMNIGRQLASDLKDYSSRIDLREE